MVALNPIIPGFAPDPSAIFVDGWFYLVTSSFHLFPGLPIYASEDLVSWKHIGNAIDRQSQLSIYKSRTGLSEPAAETGGRVLPATGGLYAPTLRYHDGVFYIVCTNALRDPGAARANKQNFILSTKDIWKGEWSDPVYFQFEGIDPSITFDGGKVYVQGSGTPGPATRIQNFEIDIKTGERLTEERTIWTGTGGVYPEGPHIFKWEGWYYLIIAEGGTHITHSVTAARSKSIWGPYEAAKNNPILTAYGTDGYIQHTGHADIFQDGSGKWWAVCLGVRKSQERYVLSRETFLTSVEWQQGWPYINPVTTSVTVPNGTQVVKTLCATSPEVEYLYVRDAELDRYRFEQDGQVLSLKPSSADLSAPDSSPTFVAKRQRLLQGRSTARVSQFVDSWSANMVRFGFACYKDEHRFFRIYYDAVDSHVLFELVNAAQNIRRTTRKPLGAVSKIIFTFEYTEAEYKVQYSIEGDSAAAVVLATVDTAEMTDPDFVGPIIGVFAIAEEEGSEVRFEDIQIV